MSAPARRADRPLTGRHVAALFGGGFTVVVAVNVALAVRAVRIFPGLETASSHVAGRIFDADRAAREALGWDVAATHRGGVLRPAARGPDGAPVRPGIVGVTPGRATQVAQDMAPDLEWDGAAFVARVALAPGNWTLWADLRASDGTPFRRRMSARVPR